MVLSMPNVTLEQIVFLRSEFVRRGWFCGFHQHYFQHMCTEDRASVVRGVRGPGPPGYFGLSADQLAVILFPLVFTGNLAMFASSFTSCPVRSHRSGRSRAGDSGVQDISVSALRVCTELATKSRAKAAPGGGEAGAAHDHGG